LKSTLHKLLIFCCALYLSGAHWIVLQSTAWTGMVISRSMTASVAEAVESTFDGQHPCPLCSAITDGKQTEGQAEKNFALLRKAGDLKFTQFNFAVLEPCLAQNWAEWPPYSPHGSLRSEAPPTPPPLA